MSGALTTTAKVTDLAAGTPTTSTLIAAFDPSTGAATKITVAQLLALAGGTTYATAYTTALSGTTGAVSSLVTMTFTPTSGSWPASEVLTPSVSGVSGTFSPTTVSVSGTTPGTCTFTPSAAGTASLSSSASPSMTNTTGALSYTVTATTATAATAPTAPGSATNGVAITGLSSTLTPSGAGAYASLTIAGTEQTPRTAITSGAAFSLTPASAGAATIGVYAASTGGTALATSSSFTVSAGSGRPSATMTSPVYDTTTPKFGSGALKGGSAAIALTASAGPRSVGFWFKCSTASAGGPILVNSAVGGIEVVGGAITGWHAGGTHETPGANICDGAWHWIEQIGQGNTSGIIYVDGSGTYASYGPVDDGANPTYTVVCPGASATTDFGSQAGVGEVDGLVIYAGSARIAVPTADPAYTTGMLAGYGFNGNGTSV